jgi:hypothetical protein
MRREAKIAIGGEVDQGTLLELQRLQDRNNGTVHGRTEIMWEKQVQAIKKKRGQSTTPSLLELQYPDHMSIQKSNKLLINNEMSL